MHSVSLQDWLFYFNKQSNYLNCFPFQEKNVLLYTRIAKAHLLYRVCEQVRPNGKQVGHY